jgi:hypothetical protein
MNKLLISIRRNPKDLLIWLSIVVFSLIMWWPTRNLPYHWDAAMTINKASRMLMARNFEPLIVEYSDFAHPPLFNVLHIYALRWFGDTLTTAHVLMLPFLPLYLGCSYLLAKKVFKKQLLSGSVTAIIAATPFLLSEYGQIYLDLPQATLVIAALTAQVYKKNRLAVALLTLATLTKLTAIMALPMLVFLSWKQNKKRNMYGKRLHYGSFRLLQLYSGFTTTTHIPIIG